MADLFNPPELWQPFGPFSMGCVQGEGRVLHLKGQVALDCNGEIVGPYDMRRQVQQVLENIRSVLSFVGGCMGDVISMTNYVTDMPAFMAAVDIRHAFLSSPFPVTTTVQVVNLYRPELMVEITAIAEIPRERFRAPPKAIS
jgi:enamine deaminase RidA (YjgF/YER057c/UK114 family)